MLLTNEENEALKQLMKHEAYIGFLSGSALMHTIRGEEESAQYYKDLYTLYEDENTPSKDEQ